MWNEDTIDTTTEIELNPDGSIKNKETILFGDEEYVVNIGPQHPATHGVLRFRVSLEGEIIRNGHRSKRPSKIHPHHHGRDATYRLSPFILCLSLYGPRSTDSILLWLP